MTSWPQQQRVVWRPNLERCRKRFADRLREEGASWPESAADAIVARGASGLSLEEWARRFGVTAELVMAIEAGEVADGLWPR